MAKKEKTYRISGIANMGGDDFLIENYTKELYTTATSKKQARKQFKEKFTKMWEREVYFIDVKIEEIPPPGTKK